MRDCAPETSARRVNTNGSIQNIYNPFTGGAGGVGRQQFANNQIPANMIDPIALKVMQLYPLPNTPGIGAGGLTNNYRREETRTTDRKNFDVKLNYNRTAAHQIWGKFSMMDAVVDDLTNYLGPPTNAEDDGGFTKVYQATAGHTWTLSSTMLMDMTFGFGRQNQEVLGPDFQSGNYGLDVLGIPGTNDAGIGDPRYAGYPRFQTAAGFSDVGNRDGWNPIYRDERTYSLTANLTKAKGRHDLRGGYTMNFLYLDHWQPETGNPRGYFQFLGNTTALAGGQTSNFYNQYAAFMLGLVGTANKSLQNELMTGREWQHAFYFRDRWQPTDNLTLDLGMRWELYPIMNRANGRGIDIVNPANLMVQVAGLGGNPQSNGMEAGLNNFAPRLGGIYRLNEKTVIRSGYGITYNAQPWARALRGDNDYPVTVAATYQNADQFAPYAPLAQGIPLLVGPDASSGQVRLDNAAIVYTPEVGNVDRGMVQTWNVAFERRLPYDISVDAAYVGAKGDGRLGRDRHQRAANARRRRCGTAVCVDGTHPAALVVGAAPEDALRLTAGGPQQALHPWIHVQGRLHAVEGDERPRRRTAGRRSPGTRRASSTGIGDRQGSIGGTTSSSASPISCRGRAPAATTTSPRRSTRTGRSTACLPRSPACRSKSPRAAPR